MLLLLACAPPSPTVQEVYDVPPPPGTRTVLLSGAHPHPVALGEPLVVLAGTTPVTLDVVDHTDDPPAITAYVPAAAADTLLDAARVTFR